MKKTFLTYICLLVSSFSFSQELPDFNLKKSSIVLPIYMIGTMNDKAGTLNGDTLTYQLKGQWFLDNPIKLGVNSSPQLKNPYHTVNELVMAYMSKDAKKIVSLYNASSNAAITDLVNGSSAPAFLEYLGKAQQVELLGAIEYKNGFMIYTKDATYGTHENFVVKEKGKYLLSAIDDKEPTSWNIGNYLRCNPKPLEPLNRIALPDSMNMNDSFLIETKTKPHYFVELYTSTLKQNIPIRVMDNGPLDIDPELGSVKFYLKGKSFTNGKGVYTFYIASFNYQIMQVASSLLDNRWKYTLKLY